MLKRKEEAEATLEEDIRKTAAALFPLALVTPDINSGLQTLVQGFGIGHLKANIVLLNWLESGPRGPDDQRELIYGRHLRISFRLGCSLVFLPFRLRGNQPLGPCDGSLDELLAPLPVTVAVLAAKDVDFDAEPEEGTAAETARILDALGDAERLAELSAKDAREAEAASEKVRAELAAKTSDADDPEALSKLEAGLQSFDAEAEKSRRRAARTAAKAQAAREEAQLLGLLPPLEEDDAGERQP